MSRSIKITIVAFVLLLTGMLLKIFNPSVLWSDFFVVFAMLLLLTGILLMPGRSHKH